jgi:hypothetical protein
MPSGAPIKLVVLLAIAASAAAVPTGSASAVASSMDSFGPPLTPPSFPAGHAQEMTHPM